MDYGAHFNQLCKSTSPLYAYYTTVQWIIYHRKDYKALKALQQAYEDHILYLANKDPKD